MKRSILLLAALALGAPAFAADGPELLKAKGCLNCHDIEKKKVGPAYKDVAAKYKADADAPAKITAKLKTGTGHPIKVNASDDELKTLVTYVLSLSK
jgi:cytochrome c